MGDRSAFCTTSLHNSGGPYDLPGCAHGGAPLGRTAWGGQHRALPAKLRIGSAISIAVYAWFADAPLAKADVAAPLVSESLYFGHHDALMGVKLNRQLKSQASLVEFGSFRLLVLSVQLMSTAQAAVRRSLERIKRL